MNILFIGGTGNISTDCAALLHKSGHCISVLTRGRSPVPAEYVSYRADRNDREAVATLLADLDIDVVIDFIAFDVPAVATDYELFRGRIKQFIFISTTVVYSKPPERLPITEDFPVGNRFSEYGRKKQACEEFLLTRCSEDGFPVTIVRPSHTYSAQWFPNPVTSAGFTVASRLRQQKPIFIHDDGQGLWTLTHTTDFAVALAGLVGDRDAIGETFHITSDSVLTWNQILSETCLALRVDDPAIVHIPTDFICRAAPIMEAKLRGDKAHHAVFDNAKIKRFVPEFDCKVSFREGIRRSVSWYEADPSRQVINPAMDAIFDRVISEWHGSGCPTASV